MSNLTELRNLAAEARLAQLDLNAALRAAALGEVTDRELSMAEAERDSALEFFEEAEALADEATPLFAPRPWFTDPYLAVEDVVSRETAAQTQLIETGLACRGWAAQVAEGLRAAIAEFRLSDVPSLTARLKRDIGYAQTQRRAEFDARIAAEELQLDPWATEVEQAWADETLNEG